MLFESESCNSVASTHNESELNKATFKNKKQYIIKEEKVSNVVTSISTRLISILMRSKEIANYTKLVKKQSKLIFTSKKIPSISIGDYLNRLYKYTKCDASTLIISLIYIERLLNKSKIILNETNIHRIVVASVLVSIKVNEDQKAKKKFYAIIAGMDKFELNILEREFIYEINFDLFVLPNEYFHYKTELNV